MIVYVGYLPLLDLSLHPLLGSALENAKSWSLGGTFFGSLVTIPKLLLFFGLQWGRNLALKIDYITWHPMQDVYYVVLSLRLMITYSLIVHSVPTFGVVFLKREASPLWEPCGNLSYPRFLLIGNGIHYQTRSRNSALPFLSIWFHSQSSKDMNELALLIEAIVRLKLSTFWKVPDTPPNRRLKATWDLPMSIFSCAWFERVRWLWAGEVMSIFSCTWFERMRWMWASLLVRGYTPCSLYILPFLDRKSVV